MRTNHLRNLLGWTGTILLMGSMASTADAGNIKCVVVDENGKPIEKGEMVLTELKNARERRRKTNEKGEIEFKGLDDGKFQLRGAIDGYVPANSLPMEISGKATIPCDHTLVSLNYATKLLQGTLELLQQKKVAEGEASGKKAVELMPDESGAHYVLAVAYAAGGKDTEATASIAKAAELSPEKYKDKVKTVQLMAMGVQADQLMKKSDFDAAIQKYQKMAEVDPSEGLTYFNLAVAYGRQNKINDAITAIDKALALKPGDAEMMQTKKLLEDRFMQSLDQELKAP